MKIVRIMLLLAGAGIFAASPGAFAQSSDPHHPAPSASSKQVDAPSKTKGASKRPHRLAQSAMTGHMRHQGMMDCPMMRGGRSMQGLDDEPYAWLQDEVPDDAKRPCCA